MGELGILNVGAGDTKLSFDPKNPKERARACRIVTDMIRRGYSIIVEVSDAYGKTAYQRVHKFDPETAEYIIADDQPEEVHGEASTPKRRTTRGYRRIDAGGSRAVSVSRSAGG